MTTAKLSKKMDFKGSLHGRIFLKIDTAFTTHTLAVFYRVY